eukprot:jgi/Psemu1/189639/e_gw1.91.62.1
MSASAESLVATATGSFPPSQEQQQLRAFEYTDPGGSSVTVPLTFTGQELLVSYDVDGSPFRAVLDTGSPFLLIPGSCGPNTRLKSGCYRNQGRPLPELEPTIEIFDGFEGEVQWRSGTFGFALGDGKGKGDDAAETTAASPVQPPLALAADDNKTNPKAELIFGVASEDIMGGPGGVFFGMIRDTDARIRPSFLGQTDVRAFRVDLRSRPRTLTLSNRALMGRASSPESIPDFIPMTNVLRRKYGDPVGHYTARAQSMVVNGYPLVDATTGSNKNNDQILVIFDTGVTGMVVSRSLFDEQYQLARSTKQKNLFGNVELTFATEGAKTITLAANKPLTTPFDPERTWKKFPKQSANAYSRGRTGKVHIIVMGLAFLEDRSLTIDIDEERLWVA